MPIYLASTTAEPERILADGVAEDCIELTAGLCAVQTDRTRSQLYHRLKALQGSDEPLLVAELTEVPKFTRLAPGSLAWLRSRLS